jgi:hypothetical protein
MREFILAICLSFCPELTILKDNVIYANISCFLKIRKGVMA